jgi:hypothetical protein
MEVREERRASRATGKITVRRDQSGVKWERGGIQIINSQVCIAMAYQWMI